MNLQNRKFSFKFLFCANGRAMCPDTDVQSFDKIRKRMEDLDERDAKSTTLSAGVWCSFFGFVTALPPFSEFR